jgi:hypothetical protein
MGENLAILNKWNEEISKYKPLKLDEAKAIYEELLKTNEKDLKKEYMNQLVTGTLHVVASFIKRNNFIYLNSPSYDMNDIINTCNTIWLEKIIDGQLLNVDSYSLMFDSNFYNQFKELLGISDIQISDTFGITSIIFFELLDEYIKFKESSQKQDFAAFMHILYNAEGSYYTFHRYNLDEFVINKVFYLFDEIIKSFEISDDDSIKISKTTLIKLRNIIISNALEYSRKPITEVIETDSTDLVIEEECRRKVKDVFYSSRIRDRHKTVVEKLLGLKDGKAKTLDEVSKELGVTRERVRQITKKTIRALRHPIYTKQLKSLID